MKTENEWTNLADSPEHKSLKEKFGAVISENPVEPGMGPKSKALRLQLNGEDYQWVPATAAKEGGRKN